MVDRYEKVLEENSNLKKALNQTKRRLEMLNDQLSTQKSIEQSNNKKYERMKRELETEKQKNMELSQKKSELESNFQLTIRGFKDAIEKKEQELEEMQCKLLPTFDHDMMRIKIINQLEIPHRNDLERKEHELQKANQDLFEANRKTEINNAKLDILRRDYQNEIKIMRERHLVNYHDKSEVNRLMNQLSIANRGIDREGLKNARRQIEDLKLKLLEKNDKISSLKEDVEFFKEDISQCNQTHKPLITELREETKNLQALMEQSKRKEALIQNQMNNLKQKLATARMQIENLELTNYNNQGMINTIQQKNKNMVNNNQLQTAKLKRQLESAKDQIDKYRRQKNQLVSQNKIHIDSRQREKKFFQQKERDLLQQIEKVQNIYNKVKSDRENQRIKNLQLQKQIQQITQDISQVRKNKKTIKHIERIQQQLQQQEKQQDHNRPKKISIKHAYNKDISPKSIIKSVQNIKQFQRSQNNKQQNKNTHEMEHYSKMNKDISKDMSKDKIKDQKNFNQKIKRLTDKNNKLKAKLKQANQKIVELLTQKLNVAPVSGQPFGEQQLAVTQNQKPINTQYFGSLGSYDLPPYIDIFPPKNPQETLLLQRAQKLIQPRFYC